MRLIAVVLLLFMLSSSADAGWRAKERFETRQQAKVQVMPQLLVLKAQENVWRQEKRAHQWGTAENATGIVLRAINPLSWFIPRFR